MSDKANDKRSMFMPLVKSSDGKVMGILSDNSIDRDDEIVSKAFLKKVQNGNIYLPALIDHENKVLSNVAEWIDKRIEKVDGHYALLANPRWFKNNPNAEIVRKMIEEDGAQMGVSIGAIVTSWSDVDINGKSYRQFDDGEILEASFTPVPANSHARVVAIAKSYESKLKIKQNGDNNMPEDKINKTENEPDKEEDQSSEDEPKSKSVTISEKNISELIEKSAKQIAEKMFSEKLDKAVSLEVEKRMNDRFEELKAIKRTDDDMKDDPALKTEKSNSIDVSKLEPTPANFIAAQKGFKIN